MLKGRVWVALHMHAGDGNVHTNIPVNSDDYEMLQTAHEAVERIMVLARSLDGVISGEHGIGITKLEFLTDEETRRLRRLQAARSTPKAASTRASCYLKAVGYATKSASAAALPKMVLIGDIVGDDADAVARATSEVVRIANARIGEGFVAVSADARKKFWLDRKRTAAISKHTNAFKINEDVVIPLPRMGEYTDGIERINIELSLRNKLAAGRCAGGASSPRQRCRSASSDDASEIPSAELLEDRVQQALALLREVRALWQHWLDQLDAPTPRAAHVLRAAAGPHACALAGRRRCREPLQRALRRRARSRRSSTSASASTSEVLHGRVWVALHMHAGDGNVHTNIPVNSDDYEMLQTAHAAVARIMALARSPRRRDLRRARHRHHQARVPDRRRAARLRRLQAARRSRRAASTRASCCAARRSAATTARTPT